jgi:hypothetical protein
MDKYVQQRLRQLKCAGVTRVKVLTTGRVDECRHCRALQSVVFNIDQFPEIPPPRCKCALGCGCTVTRAVDEEALKAMVDNRELRFQEAQRRAAELELQQSLRELSPTKRCWSQYQASAAQLKASGRQFTRDFANWAVTGTKLCIQLLKTTPRHAQEARTRSRLLLHQCRGALAAWRTQITALAPAGLGAGRKRPPTARRSVMGREQI